MALPCNRKGAPFGAPSSLAAAAAAVVLAAVPVIAVAAAAVAEDQQEDDDPPPVVAAEAPADPIVVRTHNRYLRSFCWAFAAHTPCYDGGFFLCGGGLGRLNKKRISKPYVVFLFVN